MRAGHISDLHYSPEHLAEVDGCVSFAVSKIIDERCEVAILSGDLFDHRVDLHDPCVYALMKRVKQLADHMPVLILQGTFSHDTPGSLNVFKTIGGKYPVHVADSIGQVALIRNIIDDQLAWIPSTNGYTFNNINEPIENELTLNHCKVKAIFSTLPPINKGQIAATDTTDTATAAGEYVHDLMRGWSVINEAASLAGIPTIIVSHGTVNNCMTEQGVPMHGNDHEFSTGSLFASKASAIMLGHIHQHQEWKSETDQTIAYPGSPGRLHFGELTDKGFLIWSIEHAESTAVFYTTPAKKLIQIDFTEKPDLEKLKAMAEGAGGAHVRIRYEINEEDKGSVDKDQLRAIFGEAAEIKIEPRIKPVTRIRAEGISRETSLDSKLETWCQVTDNESVPLLERLMEIQTIDPIMIIDIVMEEVQNDKKEEAAA